MVSSSLFSFARRLGPKSEILRDVKTGEGNWKRMMFAPYLNDLAVQQHPSVTILAPTSDIDTSSNHTMHSSNTTFFLNKKLDCSVVSLYPLLPVHHHPSIITIIRHKPFDRWIMLWRSRCKKERISLIFFVHKGILTSLKPTWL